MKTQLKFYWPVLMLVLLSSCEKDDVGSGIIEGTDSESLKSYNNGMINSYHNDVVLQWNEAISLAIDDQMPPSPEARMYAMVSLAIHDALNNIVPKYETYALDNSATDATDIAKNTITQLADAAVAQAAHDVLTSLFPPSMELADNLLNTSLSAIENADLKNRGRAIGAEVAEAILLKRSNDIPLVFSSYQLGSEPGIHQSNYTPWAIANPPVWPDNAVYGANMANLTPFGMLSSDQFRAVPPDAVTSAAFAEDFNEVKRLGCADCAQRTPEQTQIGTFWIENVCSSTSRLTRYLAKKEKLNGWETARLLALVAISQIDANISSFEGKYHYNFWRPITAIRAGDSDGNDATTGDPGWTPLFLTPPTPDYPSTHAYSGGAGSELLKLYFGKDKIAVNVTSPYYLPGVERTLSSFTQLGRENALSRIYIGYHFRKAVVEGEKMGRELGKYVYQNSLKELKKS